MSLILEALKRAETQRGPEGTPIPDGGHQPRGLTRPRVRFWALAGVFCVVAMVGAVFLRGAARPAREGSVPGKAVPSLPRPPVVAPSAEVPQPLAPQSSPATANVPREKLVAMIPSFVARPAPATVVAPKKIAPVPPKVEAVTAPTRTPPAQSASPAAAEPMGPQRPAQPAPVAVGQVGGAPVRDEPTDPEAASKLRETVARVEVSAHVYSEERSQRFVFINGRVYREGDRVNPEGFRIEEITADGLRVERDGVRVRVPVAR